MHCAGLAVKFPVPKSKNVIAATATVEKTAPPGSQHAVFHPVEKHVVWQLKKVTGGKTHVLRVSIATKDERVDSSSKKECGPVSLGFSVPQLNCSKLQVRYLQIGKTGPERKEKKKAANDGPHRWVRYVTKSNNFVARV
jgi:AP-4 complex subunit mu-1|tara:strand:- start:94 stop:510 length:417 start_codon:yes stop_codon:yes gene_type:complete